MDFLLHESPVPFAPIYLDERETFVVLDREDLAWAQQWLWSVKHDKHGRKIYACRTGWAKGGRISVYLHRDICLRAHGMPLPHHGVADHCDGNSLNCRRSNLRWATHSENRQNINGWYARQLKLGLA